MRQLSEKATDCDRQIMTKEAAPREEFQHGAARHSLLVFANKQKLIC